MKVKFIIDYNSLDEEYKAGDSATLDDEVAEAYIIHGVAVEVEGEEKTETDSKAKGGKK